MCLLVATVTVTGLLGCGTGATTSLRKGFLDPTAVGRFNRQALVVPILSSFDRNLDVSDERFRGATEVRAEDLTPVTDDYTIGRNDLLTVAITDLVAPNVESVRQPRVSESGMISLPLIGQVKAAGLTEAELEREISQAYKQANVIQNAQVSVAVMEARARTFSILGSVAMPGQYAILNSEFRLLDALVLARDVTAQGVDSIYVIRQPEKPKTHVAPENNPQTPPPAGDVLTPQSQVQARDVIRAQVSSTVTEGGRIVTVDGKEITVEPGTQPATGPAVTLAPATSPSSVTPPAATVDVTPSTPLGRRAFARGYTRGLQIP